MIGLLSEKLSTLFMAAPGGPCELSDKTFFFLPPWWEYLNGKYDELNICSPAVNFPHVVLPVGLAIIDMLLRLAGFIAIVAIIMAGVGYITSEGSPEKAAAARTRILNAVIGLAIVFVAAGAVAYIGNKLIP